MSALVHDVSEGGDSRRAATMLSEDVQPTRQQTSSAKGEVPDRFRGKTADQLVEMYTNLESHSGRLANTLGQTQNQLTEALALAKRTNDIRDNSGTNGPGRTEVNSIDLLTNPTKALEGFLTERIGAETKELRNHISSLENQLAQNSFNANHADAQTIFQDPKWTNFIGATPLRSQLAQRASQGDFKAADALLTEYKASRIVKARNETSDHGHRAASEINLESGGGGGDESRPAGKIYKRADVLALMQQDPDKYYSDGVQATLMRARLEGRIVD